MPFQLIIPHTTTPVISSIILYDANTNAAIGSNRLADFTGTGLVIKQFAEQDYDIIVYPSTDNALGLIPNGRYYLCLTVNATDYYSEIFTVVNDIEPYLKIMWWNFEDLTMDAGAIVYDSPAFKNILYLDSDIAKPEYLFEEEGENRDGYFFPTKQISEKRYRFAFLASEYLLDVMRFIRMSDFVEIEYHGQKFKPDTFLITPNWENNGDVAVVDAEFETDTVAKKIPYISIPIVPPTPPTPTYYLRVSPVSLEFPTAGGQLTINIESNVSWSLTVPAWINASALSGSGDATITLTASSASETRTGTVAITGENATSASVALSQTVTIVPSLSVSPNNRTYDNAARTFYYQVACNGRWRVKSISVDWLVCTASGTGNGSATIQILANTGSSTRNGTIVWEMVDYPAVTYTTYIAQSPAAATTTYALELGANSYTIPASGGNYTLAVYGVTYTNGVESARQQLSANDLTITASGSNAISRNGLQFSGVNLGTTRTNEETAIFSLVWNANNASASFECKQQANVDSVTAQTVTRTAQQGAITWNISGGAIADKDGDNAYLDRDIDVVTVQTITWTSGAQTSNTINEVLQGTWSVTGDGLTTDANHNRVWWVANSGSSQRTGTLTLNLGNIVVDNWSLTQAAAQVNPTQITITYRSSDQTLTLTSTQRYLHDNYIGWWTSIGQKYTALYPVVGDNVYSDTALTTFFGKVAGVTYD